VTADGLTVSASSPAIVVQDSDGTNQIGTLRQGGASTIISSRNNTSDGIIKFMGNGGGSETERLRIGSNGDISFYEDTGTTPKMVWKSADERLGIGTSSPDRTLTVNSGGTNGIATFESTDSTGVVWVADGNSSNTSQVGLGAVTNDMLLYAGGTERMRIDSSGNVGIGTDDPTAVSGSKVLEITSDTGSEVIIGSSKANSAANDLFGGLAFKSGDTNSTFPHYSGIKARAADTFGGANLEFYAGRSNYESNDPRFIIEGPQSVSGEAMRIDSSGNVGIGTDSPQSELHVSSSANTDIRLTNDTVGNDVNSGLTITMATNSFAYIKNKENAPLLFHTNDSERLRIDSSGNLLVGATAQIGTGSHLIKAIGDTLALDVYTSTSTAGRDVFAVRSDVGGTETKVGVIEANGDFQSATNSYGSISDQSVKQDIVDANSQIEDVKNIRLRNYRLIDHVTAYGDDAKVHLGVIAQELEAENMNGLVSENADGVKGVRYSVMLLKALGALQETITMVEDLQAENTQIKARLTELEG
jgi:hypothetical protein